ncbi:MAG: hypothetical protein ACEQSC_00260 [Candidatus Nanopelagicaceae bacterium]
MAGELVKIGAKRGAIALWAQILKILIAKGVPTKVLENLVWDLLTDLVGDAIKEKGKEVRLGNLGQPTVYSRSSFISVPAGAAAFVATLTVPGRFGKTHGLNGLPSVWLFNPHFASVGGYGWQAPDGSNFGYRDFTYEKEVILLPESLRPNKLGLQLAVNVSASIQWQKKR